MKRLLIGLLVSMVFLFFFIIYFSYPEIWVKLTGKEAQMCKMFKDFLYGIKGDEKVRIKSELESSVAKVCNYSVSSRYKGYVYLTLFSCDQEKIKNGLENPEELTMNEIEAYQFLSLLNVSKFAITYFDEEIKKGCNLDKVLSASAFLLHYLGSEGSGYTKLWNDFNFCKNQTLSEQKECIINLLTAEKIVTNYYLQQNLTDCEFYLDKLLQEPSIDFQTKNYLSRKHEHFCRLFNEYTNKIKERIAKSKDNYLTKYVGILGLILKRKEDLKFLNKVLIDKIPEEKYKEKFLEHYLKNGLI